MRGSFAGGATPGSFVSTWARTPSREEEIRDQEHARVAPGGRARAGSDGHRRRPGNVRPDLGNGRRAARALVCPGRDSTIRPRPFVRRVATSTGTSRRLWVRSRWRNSGEDLDRFYRDLLARGSRGRPLSPATIRRIHGILRRALQQGVRWGWLGVNPAAAASPPRVPRVEVKPPTPNDLARVLRLAETRDPELVVFVRVSAATGARRSELVALRWSDVDLDRCVVSIERGIVMGPNGLVEKDTKTHQARRVALDEATADAFETIERWCSPVPSSARWRLPRKRSCSAAM